MNVDLKIAETADIYTRLFTENEREIFASSPEFINMIRLEAFNIFKKLKFPDKKDENYKYTCLEEVFKKKYSYIFHPKSIEFETHDIFKCDIPELDTDVILVLNGFYFNPDKTLKTLPGGIIYGSLSTASREYPELFKKHYAKYADYNNNSIVALNTAFAQDGVFLFVPENTVLQKPLQIIHLLLSDQSQMINHRNLFIIEKNARANILICDHTLSPQSFLTNSVTEVFTGEDAVFDITRMQNEHNQSFQITNSHIHQLARSKVSANYITLHGGLVRNNLTVNLNGQNAENESMGLFLTDKTQHLDNFVTINHIQPNCRSNQLFKGILNDAATAAFSGRINVCKNAQNTFAYQKNNNLLLTDSAKMYSKPQLEIYADDVKCSHGATIGQLDNEALFYLRSRGISEKESKHLLMFAFALEVLSFITIPALKERITDLVEKRLRGNLSRCNYCKMKCH